jgi:ubiquinone/menaquinone biosynthesis C-methylase UbiE
MVDKDRIQREQDFHNEIFSEKTREVTNKFYSIFYLIENQYLQILSNQCEGKKILEYGCGEGSSAYILAQKKGLVTGIDISDYAISQAQKKAQEMNLDIFFMHMNAEGIIHHLDIHKSYSEISRVLKSDGKAVFMEPLGHNFLINWYRKRTPSLRTEDEHPLLKSDLKLLNTYFTNTRYHFFFFSSLVAILFRKTKMFKPLLITFHSFDRFVFWLLPFLKWQAWFVLMEFSEPKKEKKHS